MDESQSTTMSPSYMDQAHPNLIRWFEDYREELQRLKHVWAGEVGVDGGEKGTVYIKKNKAIMNNDGLQTLIPLVENTISKAPLSDLDEEIINKICVIIGDNIAKNLIMNYKDWEMDLNLSTFDLIVDELVIFVHIVLRRAQDGGERSFLKDTTQVSEIHTERQEKPKGAFFSRIFKN